MTKHVARLPSLRLIMKPSLDNMSALSCCRLTPNHAAGDLLRASMSDELAHQPAQALSLEIGPHATANSAPHPRALKIGHTQKVVDFTIATKAISRLGSICVSGRGERGLAAWDPRKKRRAIINRDAVSERWVEVSVSRTNGTNPHPAIASILRPTNRGRPYVWLSLLALRDDAHVGICSGRR